MKIFYKHSVVIVFLFVIFIFKWVYATPNANIEEVYSNEELPSIVIAYSLLCSRYETFRPLEANPQNVLIKLGGNIDKLKGGVSTGLGFVHRVFTVQNNIKDHVSGYIRIKNKTLKESGVPDESLLFVTTPIESFGNKILVIMGSVSPERTTIFSVDNKLNVELLYDTFDKNNIKNKAGPNQSPPGPRPHILPD